MNELYVRKELPDDDRFVFVPEEEIRAIESIYYKMVRAKLEFNNSKITKCKKAMDDCW